MGSFKANLYQGIAVLFGNSLNKKYDPEGDDRYTERVVRMVEAGIINIQGVGSQPTLFFAFFRLHFALHYLLIR